MHGLLAMYECKKLSYHLLLKKTQGPVKSMEYFGLTRHTESMSVKIPEETIKELLKKLNEDAFVF
jgi:hypothetical protein